jgi:hypothetical protein
MREPVVACYQRIHSVTLENGEFLTVYVPTPTDPSRKIQIEIRVTKEHGPEIFCDCLPVKTWDDWQSVEE